MNSSSNVRFLLINEVSLEGLDGITLQALWLRISEETKTKLPFPEALEIDYWNIIRRISDLNFYELEEPRSDLVLYDRFMYIDTETECSYYEPDETPNDIYTHKAINDVEKGVRGSCATYYTRKDVSEEGRKTEYKDAKKRWGNKLVIVASQECRDHGLIGSQTSCNVELTLIRYCILERIGRSRYHGEITQGKRSLQILGEDPKSLFYHRKVLLKHKLITKQIYHQKCGAQNFSGTLLHLTRYYSEKKSKPLILTEQIVEILKNKPHYRALYSDITAQLNITSTMKKLFKSQEFQRFVKTDIKLPYREFYPEAKISEWKHKNSDKERLIRVMQLIDPDIDVAEHWCKLDENEEEEEETGYQNYENLCYGVSLLSQAAAIVRSHGGNGCCQAELGEIMGQGKLNARSFCRNLLRRNVVTCVMNDVGRQRVTRFVSRKFEHKGQMTLQFKQERDKMMTLLSSINTDATQNSTEPDLFLAESDTEDFDSTVTKADTNMSDTSSVSIVPESKEDILSEVLKSEAVSTSKSGKDIKVSVQIFNSKNSEETIIVDSESNQELIKSQDESSMDVEEESPRKKIKRQENEIKLAQKRKVPIDSQKEEPESKKIKITDNRSNIPQKDIDNIEVKMIVAKTIPGLKGYSQGFSEQLKNEMLNASCLDGSKVTYRLLRRANFIIECVRQEKVIADLTKLIKMIQEDEKDEGYNVKIDKKSLMRLLLKLAKDGYVKYMKATLVSGQKVKSICFVCDPSITENHSVIQSALEQAKMKFYIEVKPPPKLLPKKKDEENVDDTFNTELLNQGRKEMQMVSSFGKIEYKYDRTAARKYGFSPKFVRMRLIHELLFHLIYAPPEEHVSDQEEMRQILTELGQTVDEKLVEELSPIYFKKSVCWKTFIPPIPSHAGWPKGWTLICDVLLRLPLSIFVQCFNVPYKINDLEYYLNHPVRKHVLVRNLPPKMRNGLMFKRKYIFAMHEIVSRLCYIGLVQFGPQRLKEKDQVFIYLNKKASLLNTMPSQPGYHETTRMDYERHMYYFKNIQDIEQYWYELWTICMNTTLGGRLCVTGKYIVLEQLHTKQAMLDAVLPRLPHGAPQRDDGEVPGDKRGAAGFDSALFAHLKRNWNWLNTSEMVEYESKQLQRKKADATVKLRNPSKPDEMIEIKKHIVLGPARPLNKIRRAVPPPKSPEQRPKKFKIKQKQIVRKVLPVRSKRKPFYDEVDKMALKKMDKLRTDWSPFEDHVLLLCTVGSKYLCPNRRRQIVSFAVIRDVLHKLVHTSACKTSRACQRRILYIMKNANTRRSVNMCLEEIRQNASISKKYSDILKRTQIQHIPETELNIAFVELVAYMSKMFSNLIKPEKKKICNLPSTIKEFKENFIICGTLKKSTSHFKEPQTINDINFSVVKTIIHSSMCCIKDKTSWAYQLFKVYQQYPEALLRSVITKSRHEQMISLKKAFIKSHKSKACLPLSSSPYQLSISYKYQLHSKYPYTIFQEAFEILKSIADWENETQQNRENQTMEGIEVQCPRSGTAIALMEMAQKVDVEFKFEIPEDVIILDQKVQDDSAYDRIIKRYYNILRDPQNFSGWEKKQRAQNGSDEDEEHFPNFNLDESIKKNMDSFPRPTSRIAFYMMRAEMCEGVDDKSTQHLHDFFVVNASKVFLKLPDSLKNLENLNPEDLSEDLSLIKTKISHEIISSIKNNAIIPIECASESELLESFTTIEANENDVTFAKNIINYILENGILGATLNELKELLPNPYEGKMELLDILDILTDLRILIQTGISRIRYVHFEHKKPWIINSYKILRLDREKMPTVINCTKEQLTEKLFRHKKNFSYIELQKSKQRLDLTTQQEVRVLISPWIRIDGSLNRRVLDRWLGSVLIAIIDQPGITLEALSHKFHYMKPIDIMTLVKYLTKLKCIQQSVIRKSKTTLFSSIPNITQVPATGLEDPKEILIEPYCDAVTKLAIFIGEKAYSTDFLLQ